MTEFVLSAGHYASHSANGSQPLSVCLSLEHELSLTSLLTQEVPEANGTRAIKSHWRAEFSSSSARPSGNVPFSILQDNFISLNIEDGNLMVKYKLNSEPTKEKGIRDTINNGRDHMVWSLFI